MASSLPPTGNRFEALDGWRGICACLVVLFHFHGFSPLYTSGLIQNSYLFVDFFFVLSGFVIACNYSTRLGTWDELKRFLVLRVGRVYPLHLFMLALLVAFEVFRLYRGAADASDVSVFAGETQPLAILSNLLLVQSLNIHDSLTWNGPAWSISTELWTYVIFAMVTLSLGMRNWMLMLTALAAPVLLLLLSTSGMNTTYDWGLIRCVFGFALGVACFRLHRALPQAPAATSSLFMSLLEAVVVTAVIVFVSCADMGVWSFMAPFVFAAAVLVFAAEDGVVSRLLRTPVLRWLGMVSYSIYMTHIFFVMIFPRIAKRLAGQDLWTAMPLDNGQFVLAFGRNALEGTLFYAAVLGLTLAFSAITYRWIEVPGREWTRRWMRPSAPLPVASPQRT
ncbi:acyltransferase [Caenimonas sp. SL110]|uniref:acyltransferase family protein n=1 Tax=Caenimonas sp. SL110 TaxID=1450524 RepID=UPI00065383D2|nr:acyltransferase [Caenimonas sp. SL110]